MVPDTLNNKEFFVLLEDATSGLLEMISSVHPTLANVVPFKDSWTAAQLATHVTKSNKAIVQALNMEGKPANRNPDERVEELKKMFLDFTIKFNSPEFTRPNKDHYEKDALVADLQTSIWQLRETGSRANLSEIISLPAFGEITKLELLHFVLYHTQRHTRQLKNILKAIKNNVHNIGKS